MGTAIELDVNADAALRQTLEYWQSLRGPRRMPARKDLNPADIPRLLPKLMLADVGRVDAGTDFPPIRFRLVGTEVVGRFGYELTGCSLSEIDYGDQADEVATLYRRTVDDGRPHFPHAAFAFAVVRRRHQRQHDPDSGSLPINPLPDARVRIGLRPAWRIGLPGRITSE